MDLTRPLLFLAMAALCGVAAPQAKAIPAVVLRGAGDNPPGHPLARSRDRFIKEIAAQSGGKITIRWLGGREVVADDEIAMAVADGVFDIGSTSNTSYENLIPEALTLDGNPQVGSGYRKRGYYDYLEKVYNKRGLHLIAAFRGMHFYLFLGKRVPVPKSPEDLSGLKIRLPGQYTEFPRALGMRPVRLAPADMYTALDTGLIDGTLTTAVGIVAAGMQAITGSIIDIPLYTANITLFMNLDTWNRLPEVDRKLITRVAIQVENWTVEDLSQLQRRAMKKLRAAKVTFVSFSPTDNARFRNVAFDMFWKQVIQSLPHEGPVLRRLSGQ